MTRGTLSGKLGGTPSDTQKRTTAIKICGLTRPADAHCAEDSGASYLGAIFAGGPRLVTPETALHVLGPRRSGIKRVGVFGNQTPSEIISIAAKIDLDIIQLHGTPRSHSPNALEAGVQPDGDWRVRVELVRELRRLVSCVLWPVVRVPATGLPEGTVELAEAAGAIVLDAYVVGQLGGTGVALDWSGLRSKVRDLRLTVPDLTLVLAGGLTSKNVREAVELLDPDVVDVSSGVEEAPGVKDPVRIKQFVEAARVAAGLL